MAGRAIRAALRFNIHARAEPWLGELWLKILMTNFPYVIWLSHIIQAGIKLLLIYLSWPTRTEVTKYLNIIQFSKLRCKIFHQWLSRRIRVPTSIQKWPNFLVYLWIHIVRWPMSLQDKEYDAALILDPIERNSSSKYLDHRLRINKEVKIVSYLEGSQAKCPDGNISAVVFPFAGNSH